MAVHGAGIQITITLPKSIVDRVDEMSAQTGYKRAAIYRRILEAHFERLDAENGRASIELARDGETVL